MGRKTKQASEPWQRLLHSKDLSVDLCAIYSTEFLEQFAQRFDREPDQIELLRGVIETGKAFVKGKWLKLSGKDRLLKFSGVHFIGAGLGARRVAESLRQLSKSDLASRGLTSSLADYVARSDHLPAAQEAYRAAISQSGPKTQLEALHQLASALEAAVEQLIPLPGEHEEEEEVRARALEFVETINSKPKKLTPKNHALEEAARAFRPLWERYSEIPYIRGRYRHEIGGYDSKPAEALFEIVTRLDSTIASSLAGTAIENIRKQP